jgi:chaperonin GroES
MPIIPLYDHVIIKRVEANNKTASGLIVASAATPDQWYGQVVAVGQGKLLQNGDILPLIVEVGHTVVISTKSDYREPINVDGVELYAFRENELVGILSETVAEDQTTEDA